MDPAAFVLQRFDADERPEIERLVEDAAAVVDRYVTDPERAIQMAGERRPDR
jgi:peptidyl-tRNA hydrolase